MAKEESNKAIMENWSNIRLWCGSLCA